MKRWVLKIWYTVTSLTHDIYPSWWGMLEIWYSITWKICMANIQDMIRYSGEICIARDQELHPLLPFFFFPYFAFLIIINRESLTFWHTFSKSCIKLNFGESLETKYFHLGRNNIDHRDCNFSNTRGIWLESKRCHSTSL